MKRHVPRKVVSVNCGNRRGRLGTGQGMLGEPVGRGLGKGAVPPQAQELLCLGRSPPRRLVTGEQAGPSVDRHG